MQTMLLRLHVMRDAPKDAGTPSAPGADQDEVRHLRAKADEYYQRGLEHLSHQSIPITAKMLALFDLWLHQVRPLLLSHLFADVLSS